MKKIFVLLLIGICLHSCVYTDVPEVSFDVTTDKTTYRVGDTITFHISGNPDFINFYPGISGYNYKYKDRDTLTGQTFIRFSSYLQGSLLNDSLKLMISTDYKPDFTSGKQVFNKTNLRNGVWTDISSRAILSTGADNTLSGAVNISDYVKAYNNVYVAFRKKDSYNATVRQNTWIIRSFNLYVKSAENDSFPIVNLSTAGWTYVDSLNTAVKWTISSTALTATGGAAKSAINEDWIITKALTPINCTPSLALPVKWVDIKRTEVYQYIYKTPGTYELVFLGKNLTKYDSKQLERRLTFTITN
ncbi:MAG: DUF5017 domain-containing protein [Bacteroidales bacterium]